MLSDARTRDASSRASANDHRLSSRLSEIETIASASANGAPGAPCRSIFSAKLSLTSGYQVTSGIVSPIFTGDVDPSNSMPTKSISFVQNSSELSTDHFHSASYPPSTPTLFWNFFIAVCSITEGGLTSPFAPPPLAPRPPRWQPAAAAVAYLDGWLVKVAPRSPSGGAGSASSVAIIVGRAARVDVKG